METPATFRPAAKQRVIVSSLGFQKLILQILTPHFVPIDPRIRVKGSRPSKQICEEIEGGIRPEVPRLQLLLVSIMTRYEQYHQYLLPSHLDIGGDSLNFGRARSGWH